MALSVRGGMRVFSGILAAVFFFVPVLPGCDGGRSSELAGGYAPYAGAGKRPEAAASAFTDPRDDKKYRTVEIGGKTWMAENLNFKAGDSWCYGDDDGNCQRYGRLYTWDAAMKACPSGWRLPDDKEWDNLVRAAGGNEVAGKKLKSAAGWVKNGNGADDFGFSALPGGRRRGAAGFFYYAGTGGRWWSASEYGSDSAWCRYMNSSTEKVSENNDSKNCGYSVRCVQF